MVPVTTLSIALSIFLPSAFAFEFFPIFREELQCAFGRHNDSILYEQFPLNFCYDLGGHSIAYQCYKGLLSRSEYHHSSQCQGTPSTQQYEIRKDVEIDCDHWDSSPLHVNSSCDIDEEEVVILNQFWRQTGDVCNKSMDSDSLYAVSSVIINRCIATSTEKHSPAVFNEYDIQSTPSILTQYTYRSLADCLAPSFPLRILRIEPTYCSDDFFYEIFTAPPTLSPTAMPTEVPSITLITADTISSDEDGEDVLSASPTQRPPDFNNSAVSLPNTHCVISLLLFVIFLHFF